MIISAFDRGENIIGNGEIACTSNFSFSHNVFKRLFPRPVKRCHCVGMGYLITGKSQEMHGNVTCGHDMTKSMR